jgi:type IV secretion system protein VirB11
MVINVETHTRLKQKLSAEMRQIVPFLQEDKVIEVMLNPDGKLWVERMGEGMKDTGIIIPALDSILMMNTLASIWGKTVKEDEPILEGELPFSGERFEGLFPPLVSQPSFAIRKKATSIFTLEQYVQNNIISQDVALYLKNAIKMHKNILVAGSTGSGKTTLLNALIHEMSISCANDRVLVIEDTAELQCAAHNKFEMKSSLHVDMIRLLKAVMRLRPDRILVGEVRDGAALALLKAWNTGHPGGLGTLHANNALSALIRLDQLCQEANVPSQATLIGEAVDVVIFIRKTHTGRRVEEVVEVNGFDALKQEFTVTSVFDYSKQ